MKPKVYYGGHRCGFFRSGKQNTMKLLLLTLLAAVAIATPIPMDDPSGDAVEVVVNGLAEGQALDILHIVDVKVKDIVDGEVAAVANALHPFTAEGLAEAAAAAAVAEEAAVIAKPIAPEVPEIDVAEPSTPEVIVPEPIVLPAPVAPEVVPEPIVLPEPAVPEVVPEPIVLPEPVAPEVIPEPIVVPEPAVPEVEQEPVAVAELPVVADAPQLNGEIFNDGVVSITVNTPQDAGVIATLSSWVSMMVNYVNSGIAYTQQLI